MRARQMLAGLSRLLSLAGAAPVKPGRRGRKTSPPRGRTHAYAGYFHQTLVRQTVKYPANGSRP